MTQNSLIPVTLQTSKNSNFLSIKFRHSFQTNWFFRKTKRLSIIKQRFCCCITAILIVRKDMKHFCRFWEEIQMFAQDSETPSSHFLYNRIYLITYSLLGLNITIYLKTTNLILLDDKKWIDFRDIHCFRSNCVNQNRSFLWRYSTDSSFNPIYH